VQRIRERERETDHAILVCLARVLVVVFIVGVRGGGRDDGDGVGLESGAGGEVETSGVLRGAGDVLGRDHAVAIGDREVHSARLRGPRLHPPALQLLDRHQHRLLQRPVPKRARFRVRNLRSHHGPFFQRRAKLERGHLCMYVVLYLAQLVQE
jgi:hypothetical protein